MTTLANFPMLNQLSDTHEVNAQFDCVPTAIAACLQYLTGKPFDGGAVKDNVYGASYKGATSADQYIGYCEQHGVKLEPLDGNPAQLVADIRFWLGQLDPLIATEPDPYANPSLGWTHVVAFNKADEPPGTLSCLDPYGGFEVTLSDAEWVKRLQFNQVWKLSKIGGHSMIPQGWTDENGVLISPASVKGGIPQHITGPFRDYILASPWPGANVALNEGHHVDQLELSNPSLGSGWVQDFRYARLEKPDNGPDAGKVIYGWNGVELLHLQQLYAAAQAQLAAVHDPQAVANRLTALAQLGHQIETVANQPL